MVGKPFHFTHYKRGAYLVARELADLVMHLTARVPGGHHKMVDQIVRAATGAEAPRRPMARSQSRYSAKQKRQRFVEARGEAGEIAAHLERLGRYRFITPAQLMQGLGLADRL